MSRLESGEGVTQRSVLKWIPAGDIAEWSPGSLEPASVMAQVQGEGQSTSCQGSLSSLWRAAGITLSVGLGWDVEGGPQTESSLAGSPPPSPGPPSFPGMQSNGGWGGVGRAPYSLSWNLPHTL